MLKRSSTILSKNLYRLAIAGGVAFWAATIATSLLPISAEYRASFSNRSWSIQTVWVVSLLGGVMIGCCVSWFLLRFFGKISTKNSIPRSVLLSFVALAIATILFDVPRSVHAPSNALYSFLIGMLLNGPRFLLLGVVIGYLHKRLHGSA